MTGTALTEEEEFSGIYDLDVVEIPTNKPVIRLDDPDVVYKTEAGKFRAVIRQIKECHEKGQPVLVGTISIEKSELLSQMLKREGIAHNVLNAKHHEKEAEIVAQAGRLGAVTIATNMMKFVVDTHVASAFGEQQHLTDRAQFAELLSHFENVCFAKGEWLVSDEELPKLTPEDVTEKLLSLMSAAMSMPAQAIGSRPTAVSTL